MQPDILRHQQHINDLFDKGKTLKGDAEVQSHFAKYLCVLVSGYIEKSVRVIFSSYAQNRSTPPLAKYVCDSVGDFQNAKMGKIIELFRSFDPSWAEALEQDTQGARKDAIDSVVANRHKIAHGDNSDISYVRMLGYWKFVKEVVDLIEGKVK